MKESAVTGPSNGFLPRALRAIASRILVVALAIPLFLFAFAGDAFSTGTFTITVSGSVRDMVTGAPIPGAVVSLPERGVSLKTDGSGKLVATTVTLPEGLDKTKLSIQASGYRGETGDLELYPGARVTVDPQLVSVGNPSKVVVSYEAAQLGATPSRAAPPLEGVAEPAFDPQALGLYSIQGTTGIPQTIRVYRVALGIVEVIPFKTYCKYVLPSEWIASWPMESLKAGAMGVKTYAWYWISQGGKWPSLGADVKDTTADQVYDPTHSSLSTDEAIDFIWNVKMTRGGVLFQSHYCAGEYMPGYYAGYEGWMTQWGTHYWADQGMNWQWMLHYYYDPYGAIALTTVRRAPSDFNGDGISDGLAVYDYGGATAALWNFASSGSTLRPARWWYSGNGTFDPGRAKWVTGDFNGDGSTDAAVFYDYGETTTGIWIFTSDGVTGFSGPRRAFLSSSWSAGATKPVAGDFDGDGKDEIAALYDYGGTTMGVWLFNNLDDWTIYPTRVLITPVWDWNRSTFLAGDYDGNGVSDILAVYNYGGSTTGIWAFPFTAGGVFTWQRPIFLTDQWFYGNARYFSGDIDGNGLTDIIAPYNYGGTTTGIWVFRSTGAQLYPLRSYVTPYWDYSRTTFLGGDQTGDGYADLLAIYDYPDGTTGGWIFPSNGFAVGYPYKVYSTTAWYNWAARWISPN